MKSQRLTIFCRYDNTAIFSYFYSSIAHVMPLTRSLAWPFFLLNIIACSLLLDKLLIALHKTRVARQRDAPVLLLALEMSHLYRAITRKMAVDHMEAKQQYDYIIVGGGTVGCVVAARLAEN